MKMTVDRFNEVVGQYAKDVLVPAAKQNTTRFRIGFLLGLGRLGLYGDLLEGAKALGVVDDGSVDVDLLKAAVYRGFEMSGTLHIPQLGITVDRSDADKFFTLVGTGVVS